MRTAFVIVFVMFLSACQTTQIVATETEVAICESLGETLPTRSRQDTAQTRDEITYLYATFAAVCPAQAYLIPR
jgi:hypothetical protein